MHIRILSFPINYQSLNFANLFFRLFIISKKLISFIWVSHQSDIFGDYGVSTIYYFLLALQ
ncbi:unnamed protein product [Moneuplotes crassus]|uniref:Uncharacterized protein n=1 Tax=Euplotes crassus TaxID=5936 RepID=A0AAD1UKR7_EUPCR|nr:unnamed protein product [Moneuplotes crassus]